MLLRRWQHLGRPCFLVGLDEFGMPGLVVVVRVVWRGRISVIRQWLTLGSKLADGRGRAL